ETEAAEEESSAPIAKDGPTVASPEVVTSPEPLASEPEPEAPKAIDQYVQPEPAADAPARPRRTGWWSRKAAGE
ncbi:MAG TPA: hypothetical protein VGC51_01895, partial [Hansschlegelia sp.]